MKKKKQKTVGTKLLGMPILDICVWDFSGDEDTIRHIADQINRAILLSYGLQNFESEMMKKVGR
jgi:hypothetical protein